MATDNMDLSYGNEVIRTTEDARDQVRERPSVFFGTDDVYGALNAPMEIITNGADELGAGYGDRINIVIDEDYNIEISDNGRGVPMDWNKKDNRYNWDCVYNKLFSSGKRGQGAYANAAGLNGVGAAITQFTALYMKVISRRIEAIDEDNPKKGVAYNEYEMNFENGYPKGELIKRTWNPAQSSRGTTVTFKTDPTVFQDTHFSLEMLVFKLRRLATIAGGMHYVVKFMEYEEFDIYFEKGPETFLEQNAENRLTNEIINIKGSKVVAEQIRGRVETFQVDAGASFTFSIDKPFVESYHNKAYLVENGTGYDGFKAAVANVVETQAKARGKIGNKDRITGSDIEDIIVAIVWTEFEGEFSSWDGQDKKAIKNGFLLGVFKKIISDNLTDWATTHKEEMDRVIEAVLLNRAAKDKAAAVKRQVIKKLSDGVNSFKTRPAKLADCYYGPKEGNELYIVEGESAKGSVVGARDVKLQAVYPLTGKILNCDKATPEVIFNNRVVLDLIQIFGCGVEIESKHIKDLPKFDINKLNYSKIIFSTDADVDGWHIQCLGLVFIYKTMPSLIKAGKVYIAEAPLYRIEFNVGNKRHAVYAYSDVEKADLLAKIKTAGYTKVEIHRFKGLGEMSTEQMSESLCDPATRRLTLVEWPEDPERFEKVMHELMGDDLSARKQWITEYFGEDKDASEEDDYIALDLDEQE